MGYVSYETPDDVFGALNNEFRFDVDVCAVADNAKCAKFFTPEQNGLAQDWQGVCWCNPPFDRTKPAWIKKAYESAQAGATVVVLLPWNGTGDTAWWHKYVLRASEIRYLRGRQRYTGLDGRKVTVRTVLVVFRPHCEGPPVALSCTDTGTLFPNNAVSGGAGAPYTGRDGWRKGCAVNYLKWDNRNGVVDAETGEQVLQLLKNYCSETFRRMAGKNLVNVLNNIKRGEDAAKQHTANTRLDRKEEAHGN